MRLLDTVGSPATVATTGGRFFGLVVGGTLPAALAANWLATAWGQNACFRNISPISATLEDISLGWITELFGLKALSLLGLGRDRVVRVATDQLGRMQPVALR